MILKRITLSVYTSAIPVPGTGKAAFSVIIENEYGWPIKEKSSWLPAPDTKTPDDLWAFQELIASSYIKSLTTQNPWPGGYTFNVHHSGFTPPNLDRHIYEMLNKANLSVQKVYDEIIRKQPT